MLYVNGELKTAIQVIDLVKDVKNVTINFDNLMKNSAFKVFPLMKGIDLGRSGEGLRIMKEGKGHEILNRFTFRDPSGLGSYELVYCTTTPYLNDNRKMVYKPKVTVMGAGEHSVGNNPELTLFMYLHPWCAESPFHPENGITRYSHINPDAELLLRGKKTEDVLRAINHAATIDESEIVIFARTLGISTNGLTSSQVRVVLKERAISEPIAYCKSMESEDAMFLGRIYEAVETGNIKSTAEGNHTVWSFAAGPRKGQTIIIVPAANEDKRGALIQHIKDNVQDYYHDIHALNEQSFKDKKYNEFISAQKNKTGGDTKAYVPPVDIKSLVDTNSVKVYIRETRNVNMAPASAKKLSDDIAAGVVTQENFEELVVDYLPKT